MGALGIPDAVLVAARGVASRVQDRTAALGRRVRVDADEILTGRAALLGWEPRGQVSAGGATRLLAAADGWCALTLSRPDDVEAVPALLEVDEVPADPWPRVAGAVAGRSAGEFVDRARLLGLPAAVLGETAAAAPVVARAGERVDRRLDDLLVVDMSSMWAGPLAGRLLADAGATVVKVEAPDRPDGTRAGDQAFFDSVNTGKLCYAASLDSPELKALVDAADVVITASRPHALARRGITPSHRPGRVWLRITGYGADGWDRVAFGDDAAVAGGLVGNRDGAPAFVGDAIADPLSGLAAAAAVLDELACGGGSVVDVSMAAVAATYAALPDASTVEKPTPSARYEPAHALGADNADVDRLVAGRRVPC